MKKNTTRTEMILSVSAIIIALASICISLWEGIMLRNHYRLSVRPNLEIVFNGGYQSFGYNVVNSGLGPAIITKMVISVDNQKIDHSSLMGLKNLAEKLDLAERNFSHDAIDSGVTLSAGENKVLFGCKFIDTDNREELLTKIYSRITIELVYSSMYKEQFKCKFP